MGGQSATQATVQFENVSQRDCSSLDGRAGWRVIWKRYLNGKWKFLFKFQKLKLKKQMATVAYSSYLGNRCYHFFRPISSLQILSVIMKHCEPDI